MLRIDTYKFNVINIVNIDAHNIFLSNLFLNVLYGFTR